MNAKQLTAAETIVMKCIWDADHEMSLAEIVKNANEGYGKEWKPQTVCDSCCGSGRMLLSAVKKCAEENDGGRLFCYGSDIDLICVKMTVVNLMMNSVPGEVAWMNTLTMQHWRSYHIDLQLIAGVWLPILKITEAGDTSFIRKLENAMEDNSELKRSIQSNARATQLTFDF